MALETSGTIAPETVAFFSKELGCRVKQANGEKRLFRLLVRWIVGGENFLGINIHVHLLLRLILSDQATRENQHHKLSLQNWRHCRKEREAVCGCTDAIIWEAAFVAALQLYKLYFT